MKSQTKFKQTEIGKIPEGWEILRVTDLGRVITGKTPPTKIKEYFGSDFPFIKIPDLGKSVYIEKSETMLSKKGAGYMGNLKLPKDSVMVSCLATIGKVGITKRDSFTNQQINSLICNKDKVIPLWIYYFFKNNLFYLESLGGGGSVYTNISKSRFENASIPIPRIKEQERIINILFDLDSKIEFNQQMNKSLEAIGQAIFKRWFVDFEFPNEKGKPYKSSGGEMVESELGKIPKGWGVGRFKDISKLQMGISPKGNSYNEDRKGIPLLNGAADFSGKLILPKKFTTEPIKKCNTGDLVFCIRATIGNVTFADKEFCLGRGVAALKINNNFREFFYYSLIGSLEKMISSATGSVIMGLSKTDIEDCKIIIPDNNLIKIFNKNLFSFFEMQKKLDEEIQSLSQIRDSLLPKLMSGKIRVI
ncbi:MAG: restriction endonuclease subunit S [Candidatus Pacearchaeota archaeon]|nr:MAG: restriction endonuclease subunit S [Candidatus Pacearchaeota archaeon]